MQVIQITSLTGHSPYDITICDITNTYCYSGVTGATTVPLTINLPTELLGTNEVLVVVTDSIGCEEIQYHQCATQPTPTPTPTITPTITPTNSICNCISIENPSGITLNFGYTQCDGTLFYGDIYSATTLFVCGSLPYGDTGLIINISSNVCVNDECPGPTPTPTTTPTPTPTLPPIVGYFQDSCDTSYEFTLSDIPGSFSPLSGVYYIESSGYNGCATYIGSTTSTNIFSFVAMGSQPSSYHCLISNFIYPCPTLTPTPSITPSITPTVTVTTTPTSTPTSTPTPTPTLPHSIFEVINCCTKKVKFISLPSHFLIGTSIVASDGYCYQIDSKTNVPVTEYWNNGTTYVDCSTCIKYVTCSPPSPPAFISVWQTTTSSESIMLPYETTGSYSGTINWGDGNTSINSYSNRAHTYTTPGSYTITITGTLIGWSFLVNPISQLKIYEVLQWGCLRLGNSGGYFSSCINLLLSNVSDILNLTGTFNLNEMFTNCDNLVTIQNINFWDLSNITDTSYMFSNCINFDDNLGNWDVSNVTNMKLMFESSYVFNNGGSSTISNWDTSSVTDMESMFSTALLFNQPIDSWDVSNVTNMTGMFASSQFDQPLSSWDVSNVTNMSSMFTSSLFNQNINSWDVSNVIDMSGMFTFGTFDQPIGSWDVSNVTNMSSMFTSTPFNQSIGGWNVSNVTNMYRMFQNATSFNQSIGSWDVSNVITMERMFTNSTLFDQPLSGWDVSNVTNMSRMFQNATSFNQSIGGWNVTGVTDFSFFMVGKTFSDYSTTNLDAIYNGWSSLPTLQPSINITFGTIKYTAGSSAGKAILTGTYLWTITDGGI